MNMTHELHFILNQKKLEKITEISVAMNIKSISGTIVAIFEKLMPYLEKSQIEFQNRKSEYKVIADLKEKRCHLHVYFPEKLYRHLKELHQYLNFYSLAQILREIIEIYLKDFFKSGMKKVIKKYDNIKRIWNDIKSRQIGYEFIRQLLLPDLINQSITVKYDANYQPYYIKFHDNCYKQ
jgi:hypothetical protein